MGTAILYTVYVIVLTGLGIFGLFGFVTLWCFWRYCSINQEQRTHQHTQQLKKPVDSWPTVTVQLPIFNEQFVVERLVNSAVALDYPADKLSIQVVDDSTDQTKQYAAELVQRYQTAGVQIEHVHRKNRQGFKAGALAAATQRTDTDLIAIFDADFQPPATFLKNTVPYFVQRPKLGMVQTRWGHINDSQSSLTAAQAMIMDKHFAVEQPVSFEADFFPRFNGTAGIWRRECVQDAGGWRNDTVCEDMCLSTRAILRGWEFEFLPDVITPGELPVSISAYKNQQARWAKGSFQCLLKYGPKIFFDKTHPWYARLYALITMSGYLAHPLMLLTVLLQIPLLLTGYELSSRLFVFSILGLGQPILFLLGQQLIYPDWIHRLKHFPTMMVMTIGLSPTITRAVLEVVAGKPHVFIRTPKGEINPAATVQRRWDGYRFPFDKLVFAEAALIAYCLVGLIVSVVLNLYGAFFLLACGLLGFAFVAVLGILE